MTKITKKKKKKKKCNGERTQRMNGQRQESHGSSMGERKSITNDKVALNEPRRDDHEKNT